MNFEEANEKFNKELKQDEGYKTLLKVSAIVNDVGTNFLEMNGGELSEAQSKLAGYKFYLADYVGEINRQSEALKLEIQNIRATEWDRVTEEIKAKEGKVKNKEQIENALASYTVETQYQQMLNETLYYKYKMKLSSVDSILTAIAQRIKELQKQQDQV